MTLSRLSCGLAMTVSLIATALPAAAETFTLDDGSVVEGSVVRAIGATIAIRYEVAGLLMTPISSVQQVDIPTRDGGVISGRLVSWSDGVYRLQTDAGLVDAAVEDGTVVAIVELDDDSELEDVASAPAPTAASEESGPVAINAGFVYAGLADDGGRTFMVEMGRQHLAENPAVSSTAMLEIDSDDHDQMTGAIDRLIDDGANLVFMSANDSAAAVVESAKRHQDVNFVHCGTPDPAANLQIFCGQIHQARYLSGLVAGGMTASDLIGYVAAEPTPDILIGINAFALGVQSVNPDADVVVHWTGARYAPGQAQQRAADLIERGVDVLTIHQDSPAALQVAEQQGIHAIGFQSDMQAFAPTSMLTSAIWNWGEMYGRIIEQLDQGDEQRPPRWLGLREGVVGLAPISERVPDDLKRLVQEREREIIEGRLSVFTGPIRDVDGDVRIPEGRVMADSQLQTIDYLVQGVVGY